MNSDEALLRAIGAETAEAVAELEWREDQHYGAGQLGIVVDFLPPEEGDAVALALYPVSDDVGTTDSVVGVQFTFRFADRRRLSKIRGAVFDAWHGHPRAMLGAIRLIAARRTSGTSVSQDRNGRRVCSDNYYLTVAIPTARRI